MKRLPTKFFQVPGKCGGPSAQASVIQGFIKLNAQRKNFPRFRRDTKLPCGSFART
jgi:hypothetical protein